MEDRDQCSFQTEDLLWLQLGNDLTKFLVEEVFQDGFERSRLLLVSLLSLPKGVHLREPGFEVSAESSEAGSTELEIVPVEISSFNCASEKLGFKNTRFNRENV